MTSKTPFSAGDIPMKEAGGILTIDLDALAANWRFLREKSRGAKCAAVVKANAYGTGIEQAVPALSAAGCRTFFVAHLSEASRVREIAPQSTIYVLNGLFPDTAGIYERYDLRPVLGSVPEISEWVAFCKAQGQKLPAALHIDTGMSRLGVSLAEAGQIAQGSLKESFEISLVMSHFITSEEPDHPANQAQIDAFGKAREIFPEVPASLANSSGILLPQMPHFDLVRPGYALYGGNPCPGRPNPMQPVVRLEGRIVQVRSVPQGVGVGYNSRWTSSGECRLATISVGYADGFLRSSGGTDSKRRGNQPAGAALVAGILCPFAGTVSMDLIVLDVSKVDPARVVPGDLVTLIGDELTVDRVGENAGSIGYEILTNLSSRYARRYLGGGV